MVQKEGPMKYLKNSILLQIDSPHHIRLISQFTGNLFVHLFRRRSEALRFHPPMAADIEDLDFIVMV